MTNVDQRCRRSVDEVAAKDGQGLCGCRSGDRIGLTLLIDGAGPTPADTVKVKALDESPSGLVTCTLQVEAVVVKLALRVSWPLLMKLVVLGKVPP